MSGSLVPLADLRAVVDKLNAASPWPDPGEVFLTWAAVPTEDPEVWSVVRTFPDFTHRVSEHGRCPAADCWLCAVEVHEAES